MKKSNQKKSKPKLKKRTRRIFSDAFKKQKVEDITLGLVTVSEVSKLYKVSYQAVYQWLYKYSDTYKKEVTQVVQMESEAHKTKELLKRLSELERVVGLKQMEIDYLNKLVEISSKELKIDLKKSFDTTSWQPSVQDNKEDSTR